MGIPFLTNRFSLALLSSPPVLAEYAASQRCPRRTSTGRYDDMNSWCDTASKSAPRRNPYSS